MTVDPQTEEELVAVGTAAVCADPEAIRAALLETFADATPLDDALRAVTTRDTTTPAALNVLHAALQGTGDARGLYGRLRAGEPGFQPPGQPRTGSGGAAYYCPGDRCARFWLPCPGDIPRCTLTGALLRRKPH
ncbi:hypothetical protein ACFU3E_26790 [Streptomyces sp. NPDC057424]|uniref:hypothetical protein n=1 Tax=Streptomyces sp. NPDC057424 TaxID=3346127 RepID=UPI0036A88607